MQKQRTLLIIKPDAFSKGVAGRIIAELEKAGLRLAAARFMQLDGDQARSFYGEHEGKPFYEPLIAFMTSNPVMPMVWEGEDVITRARTVIGATDPKNAQPGTIRKNWASDGRHNVIHGSDSPESAAREISFFFSETDIVSWEEKEYRI